MLHDGATPAEERVIAAHFDYLQDLTTKGVVLHAGRTLNTDPSSFGIVIFEADSEEQARGIVNGDPAVKEEVFRAELYPYRIALRGPVAAEDERE